MAFDAQLRHFRTLAEFTAYLRGVPRPAWCKGLTNHNTYKPDETEWRGLASMRSLETFYRDTRQWPSGPHLFLAAAAPDPTDTGIFQMTPITNVGVHAGDCNDTHLGIESVGNFNARPPTEEQYILLLAVNRAIMEHWMLPPETVNVHNECMIGRTCPGKYLPGAKIRADLRATWPFDPFAGWGPIGRPEGIAVAFAVPRAWLAHKELGQCVVAETYSASGKYSVTEFEEGLITYLVVRDIAVVEWF